MADFAISRLHDLPATILVLGLLYSKSQRVVGQDGTGVNLIDLCVLPLTPILGDGSAPMQPLEISDAAFRVAWLALSDPAERPLQHASGVGSRSQMGPMQEHNHHLRIYDGVGPEVMTMLQMLSKFAEFNGKKHFYPVFIDYRNMERILNIKSLGNLNRQFVSLLRSEQSSPSPAVGDSKVFDHLIPLPLLTLDDAFDSSSGRATKRRKFPFFTTLKLVIDNPRLIPPGISLSFEIISSFLRDFGR